MNKNTKLTKEKITEAIAYWTGILESMKLKEDIDGNEAKKKTIGQKLKEAVAPIGSAASLAKSAQDIVARLPEILMMGSQLTDAINRGAAALEKIAAQHESQK